ncbi:MAG: DAK2 domain-containing protein [Ruminococcaceae bacterium]|nr:DAK2 domain-containing protein [Oscillospiraceae bacterium]
MINGAQFAEMVLCAYEALESNKQAINELNVFPVPDGDTGTNMTLTVSTAATEIRKLNNAELSVVADKAASAMLRGARGNSGVILSLLFRGIAKGLKGKSEAAAPELAAAMRDGVDAAYKAVMKPAEGTILTVSRLATDAAVKCAKSGGSIELMLELALNAGRDALEKTVEQNPVLARAGVVDAGGKGYIAILEAFLGSLQGKVVSGSVVATVSDDDFDDHADFSEFSSEEITFAYDTVYIVRKLQPEVSLDPLRAYLESIGDSLVISEDDEVFKVHVHTNIPGDALTESQKYGTLETAKIENMRTQHDELVESKKAAEDAEPAVAAPEKPVGFVAVCAGDGLAQVFRDFGCDQIVTGGQTMNPSTEDILRAIERTPAETVFVFPNNKNIIMAAEQCIPLATRRVIVVPTKTVPQGITAMLNLDTYASVEQIAETFEEVIQTVHTAQVTYAARDSEFDGHSIKAGEYLGLMDGALLGSWSSAETLNSELCKTFSNYTPEYITIYYGSDVTEDDSQALYNAVSEAFPDVEVALVNGGQPVYYFMISVE